MVRDRAAAPRGRVQARRSEVHALPRAQGAAARFRVHHRGADDREQPGRRQEGLLRGHYRRGHPHRPRGRAHRGAVPAHPASGHRPSAHHRRHLRSRAVPRRHHGHAHGLPLARHPMGQPRHRVDGRRARPARLHRARGAQLRALRQPVHTGGRLRHQHPAARGVRDERLRRRPVRRVRPQGQPGPAAAGAGDEREDPEGHGHHPVQGGGAAHRRESRIRPCRPQALGQDRPRAWHGHAGRRGVRAHRHGVPHGEPGRPLPPHARGGRGHAALGAGVHGLREAAAPHAFLPGGRQPLQGVQRQPAVPRLRAAERRRLA